MTLSSKRLEELENLHDSVNDFDEESNIPSDTEEFDDTSDGTLAWRRSMIERAFTIVKNMEKNPLNSENELKIGALVYDNANNCYARIVDIFDDEISLIYTSGGTGMLRGSKIERFDQAKDLSKLIKELEDGIEFKTLSGGKNFRKN